ncbi:MAG: hypothetical protein VKL41_00850 [Snowella sp.]|nr:hypothetical protein [Snowella sp.]
MSTRVVSFRMTENQYDKMMAECHQMGIGSSEWVIQKIAYASYITYRDEELLENLKLIRRKVKYADDKKSGVEKLDEIINSLS